MTQPSKRRRKPKPIRPLGTVGTDAWNRMFTEDADWIAQSMDLELFYAMEIGANETHCEQSTSK